MASIDILSVKEIGSSLRYHMYAIGGFNLGGDRGIGEPFHLVKGNGGRGSGFGLQADLGAE